MLTDSVEDGETIDLYSNFHERFKEVEERFGVKRVALKEIPIVSFAPFSQDGSDADKQEVASQIRDACINVGFFYVEDHGISADELQETIEWSHRFFELPLEQKMKLHNKLSPAFRGYIPSETEIAVKGFEPDPKESFDICRHMASDDPEWGQPMMGDTPWPDEGLLPGFRAFMNDHLENRLDLARLLMQAIAISLNLPETYFDQMHKYPFCDMRLCYYPPQKLSQIHSRRWSCGPHTDYMAITTLLQDEVGGLEVRNLSGDWISAPRVRDTLAVNIGDILSSWTNDLYSANPHRVANVSDRNRVSVPVFMGPDSQTQVVCLETCQGEGNPPRYAPLTCSQHVTNIFKETHPKGNTNMLAERGLDATGGFRGASRVGADT